MIQICVGGESTRRAGVCSTGAGVIDTSSLAVGLFGSVVVVGKDELTNVTISDTPVASGDAWLGRMLADGETVDGPTSLVVEDGAAGCALTKGEIVVTFACASAVV